MKSKLLGRAIVSLLALAFGAWAFYEYRQSQAERQKEELASSFLPGIELEDLRAFRIEQGDKKLSISKEGKNWRLKQPVKDLADFSEISRWFDELKNQKVRKIETEEAINWTSYYLDSAPYAEMDLSSGISISFSVSEKGSFDGKYFIKKGEELFIGERWLFSEVNEKDFDAFRSKKIAPSLGRARQIQFKGKESFRLSWSKGVWALSGSSFPLDADRLDGFWSDFNSLSAEAIKEPVSPSSLKKYGLSAPQLRIALNYPGEKYSLRLSHFKEGKAFISASHRDFIFEVSKEEAEKLILSKNDIRDHSFPFAYDKSLARQIERKSGEESLTLKKEEEGWRFLGKKGKPLPAKKARELLDSVTKLKGEKYKKAPAKKALRSLEIKNSEGEIIFDLKELSREGSLSWTKTNLWGELTAVSTSSLDEIFNHEAFSGQPLGGKKEKKP